MLRPLLLSRATPPETHPVPSDLVGEARSSPVSTWVGDDLVHSQERGQELTSVTLTTPICGADKSMSNVFSQYGTNCGENQKRQLNTG